MIWPAFPLPLALAASEPSLAPQTLHCYSPAHQSKIAPAARSVQLAANSRDESGLLWSRDVVASKMLSKPTIGCISPSPYRQTRDAISGTVSPPGLTV